MATLDYSTVKGILAENGYSWTKPRELVFKAVSTNPQSISDVIKRVGGKVDRVSVYRTIDLFEKLGIVHRINVGWKYKLELSDRFVAHHHHLSCTNCGRVIDIEDEQHIDGFIKEITSKFGFKPTSHQFEIEGVCKDCLTKQQLV